MATSGHKVQYGVDTVAHPALIQGRTLNFDSVNRMYRGGDNDTRLPFQLLNLTFESDADKEYFEKASVTGIKGYNGIPPYTRSHIVVSVGNSVFVGQVNGNTADMKRIYQKLDPTLMFQFFAQGETVLVINNGKTEGIYWNGQVNAMYPISSSNYIQNNAPMPIGNICLYAHGRFWILTEDGRLYAGDHLYSQGNSASDEVLLSFSESNYPESGDGFTAPAQWGDVRSLSVISRDPSTNGHGEIVVMYVNGAYSVNPIDDRNQWTASNIQQTIFTGQGGCSPWSVVSINNDLLFRGSDKRIGSLRQVVAQRNQDFQIRPLSNEVHKYLDFDSFESLIYSMSGSDDDRAFFTVDHQVIDNPDYNGKHRFANGLVVCDFSAGTNSTPDSVSWDGLWTGPRVTGIAQLIFGTERRAIFSSFDSDGVNRLYTLRRFRGPDILASGESPIKSMYSFGNMFDSIGVDSPSDIKIFTLENSIVFYSESVGQSFIQADYRNTYSDNWFQLFQKSEIGFSPTDQIFYDLSNDIFRSDSACSSVTETNGKRAISGIGFDMRVCLWGSVKIKANLLSAGEGQMQMSRSKKCSDTHATLADDAYDYTQYQF